MTLKIQTQIQIQIQTRTLVNDFQDMQAEARAVAPAATGHVAAKKRDVPKGSKAGKRSQS